MYKTTNRARVGAAVLLTALVVLVMGGAPARALGGLEGVPAYDKVVVVVLENEDASSTFGPSSPAVWLNGIKDQGAFLPQYYGTSHLSLGNYITMVSGQVSGPTFDADCFGLSLWSCAQATEVDGGRHLGDQLDDAGVSWKSYMDGTPTPCFHSPYVAGDAKPDVYQGNSRTPPANDYADRHNPFIYFDDFVGDAARCQAHQRPFTELAGDVAGGTLSRFSFITPDTCHDGHDAPCADGSRGGIGGADDWMKVQLPALAEYLAANNGLLIVTFDEGEVSSFGKETCATCVGHGFGGRTGTVLYGAHVVPGKVDSTGYDHYALLRTIESIFGISEHLGLAAQARPITAFGETAQPVVAEVPWTPLLLVAGTGVGALALLARRRQRYSGFSKS